MVQGKRGKGAAWLRGRVGYARCGRRLMRPGAGAQGRAGWAPGRGRTRCICGGLLVIVPSHLLGGGALGALRHLLPLGVLDLQLVQPAMRAQSDSRLPGKRFFEGDAAASRVPSADAITQTV